MAVSRLQKGDVIGLVCPSHIADKERYGHIAAVIESLGFHVKMGANIYKDTYGYLAAEQERAEDFDNMVLDDNVKMVLFGGGEGGNELLPYIDYESIRKHPKFFCSYSDGTTILNAIYSKTGLKTYYGQAPGMFYDLRYYDYMQFSSHFIQCNAKTFISNSTWKTLHAGFCEGKLIGGYIENFALLLGNDYFHYDKEKKYILFLEEYEQFSSIAKASSYLSHIEQHHFINNVVGLVFWQLLK